MTIWSHEDPVPGIFNDGAFPLDRAVMVRQSMGELIIEDRSSGEVLAKWPLGALSPVTDADFPATLRLKQADGEGGRLAIFDREFNEGLTEWWPGLRRRLVIDRATLRAAALVSLAAFAGLGLFFLALLPALGRLAADLVPPDMERQAAEVFVRHGDPMLERIRADRVCDTKPIAPILKKLVEPLRAASGWPEPIRVQVIDDNWPNAASVAGGGIVIFSGLLHFVQNADEIAGVLAHEIGHVTERHAMRKLFVTNLDFFGLEQLLGNFSGQLVVDPVSGVILMGREARREEYEADRAAVRILTKAKFNVRPLADFLDRVAYLQGDEEMQLGWLSTHPLSRTRARLIRDAAPEERRAPVLTAAEFSQLRAVCATQMPRKPTRPEVSQSGGVNRQEPAPGDGSPSVSGSASPRRPPKEKKTGNETAAPAKAGTTDPTDPDNTETRREPSPSSSQTPDLNDWDHGD